MDTESSKDPEVEKVQETGQKIDPGPMKSEEEKPNAACVSAHDMIIKSLKKTKAFLSDTLMNVSEEAHQIFMEDFLGHLHDLFLSNLSHSRPLEEDVVSEILVTVLEHLPRWNSDFEVNELVKKNCDRCKTDTEYPPERSYGIIINANSLRETKYELEHFSFENILKVIRINLMMPCKKEACGKRSYVQRVIKKLPSVFTIALEWENNETGDEILDTVSVLKTEIDISVIYNSEDDCQDTKYYLVSMVCSLGDGYNCIAYENNKWVRHFGTEEEVLGDWNNVLSIFVTHNIRPVILFFENAVKRNLIVNKQRETKLAQIQQLLDCYGQY